jgi:hypothetical protein
MRPQNKQDKWSACRLIKEIHSQISTENTTGRLSKICMHKTKIKTFDCPNYITWPPLVKDHFNFLCEEPITTFIGSISMDPMSGLTMKSKGLTLTLGTGVHTTNPVECDWLWHEYSLHGDCRPIYFPSAGHDTGPAHSVVSDICTHEDVCN